MGERVAHAQRALLFANDAAQCDTGRTPAEVDRGACVCVCVCACVCVCPSCLYFFLSFATLRAPSEPPIHTAELWV